jgi:hypothetical protein
MEARMKTVLLSAALLGTVAAGDAAAGAGVFRPVPPSDAAMAGEGGNGAGSIKVAGVVTSAFLFVPNAVQSPLVTIGEGGEGGKGKKKRLRHQRESTDEKRLRRLEAEDRRLRELDAEERRVRQQLSDERRARLLAEERQQRRLAEERRRRFEEQRLLSQRPLFD